MIAGGILKPKTPAETLNLMKVALGEEKADLAIINANVANVYTGEILNDCTICVKNQWIAYVGKSAPDTIGSKTEIIDAAGQTVIPGLIEGHTHIASLFTAYEFLKHVIQGGTTTVVTETFEIFPVGGYQGVIDFLDSLKAQPIKILATAPPMVSISQKARGIDPEILAKLLIRDDIIGLGETYWQAVLQAPQLLLPLFEQTLGQGKTLEGHTAGANQKKLNAYIAGGISSCHEPIDVQQVLERLRLGLHIMIREGSIRRDLEQIAAIKAHGIDTRRLILTTDGIAPQDLLEKGYMEYVVQKAIDCGFAPIEAVQMATLNVAEHFGLDGLIGGIAPGRYADLVIIPDIHTITPHLVISNGQAIARNGELLISPRNHAFSRESRNSIKLPRQLNSADFVIPAEAKAGKVTIRIIHMVTNLVTAELRVEWPVIDAQIQPDLDQDVIKVAAVDRTHRSGQIFVGLIKGFGLKAGAIACSAAWDTSDIVVVGSNDADMATAVNRIFALQGGAVACKDGAILVELPLPIFGIISDLPLESIAQRLQQMKTTASTLGVGFPDPLLTLSTLTGAAIPYFRICEEGLVNLKDGQTLRLLAD